MSLWIEASAGTGKTYYIETIVQNQSSDLNILILTHTNAAVNELKKRIMNAYISTIHSFSYKLIESIYNYPIDEASDMNYNSIIKIANLIDLNDLNIDILILDEAQDTSEDQWILIEKIFTKLNIELFVLGDQKQLIYNFTGSSNQLYQKMKSKFNFPEKTLTQSYRHSQEIINYINKEYPQHYSEIDGGQVIETRYPIKKIIKLIKHEIQTLNFNEFVILIDSRDFKYHLLIKELNCRDYIQEARHLMLYYLFIYNDYYFILAARLFSFIDEEIEIVMQLTNTIALSVKKKSFKLSCGKILSNDLQKKLIDMFDILFQKNLDLISLINRDKITELYKLFTIEYGPDIFLFANSLIDYNDFEYNIITIHQSKGLEFDKVFFPFYTKKHGFFNEETYTNMKYVAMTRAKSYLWINQYN